MDEGLIWAAGLFEGEGSIQIARYRRGKSYGVVLSVMMTMTDRQCVEEFHRIMGCGSLVISRRKLPYRDAWMWACQSRVAARCLSAMQPHFRSDRVRDKAALGLLFQSERLIGRPARDPAHKARQWEMFERMRLLNLRGQEAIDRDAGSA